MSTTAISYTSSRDFGETHQCNCVGCCDRCGTCRTAPWHTHDYCELVQRQIKERANLIRAQRTDGVTPGLEYGTL